MVVVVVVVYAAFGHSSVPERDGKGQGEDSPMPAGSS